MKLSELQKHWNEFGRRDPLWSILSHPDMRNGQWKIDEFFKTGAAEIARAFAAIDALGLPRPSKRALDFGCGVGRLTQALCAYCNECCGVDIAPSMIELARQYNKYGAKCQYFLNENDDLRLFEDGSFDFIYSNIVLQHIRPEYSANYIKEFMRVLAPGGVLIFQIPSHLRADEHAVSDNGETVESEPGQPTNLPDAAYRARLRLSSQSITARPNQTMKIEVVVQNDSDVIWPARRMAQEHYPIKLANHWLSADGQLLTLDDGRTTLTEDVPPGASVVVPLTINMPPQPGAYTLELDLVHELIAWFANKGSPTTRIPVKLRDSKPIYAKVLGLRRRIQMAVKEERFVPHMEMHGIPRDSVVELIQQHGGKVVETQPDTYAGQEWIGFRYVVTKP